MRLLLSAAKQPRCSALRKSSRVKLRLAVRSREKLIAIRAPNSVALTARLCAALRRQPPEFSEEIIASRATDFRRKEHKVSVKQQKRHAHAEFSWRLLLPNKRHRWIRAQSRRGSHISWGVKDNPFWGPPCHFWPMPSPDEHAGYRTRAASLLRLPISVEYRDTHESYFGDMCAVIGEIVGA